MKNEIIIYQPDDLATRIDVRIEDETVWLSQVQMAELFQSTKQNISLHINNIYKEGELEKSSTVKEYLTVQTEGKRQVQRKITIYNLDVIISVGYRVKSKQGTQFRIWANKVLKDYLLKGYALNNRINRIEDNVHQLSQKVNEIDLQLKTELLPKQGIFYNGQVFDAWLLIADIIKSAKKSILLIDNYVDETVLAMLDKRKKNVDAVIYTKKITKQLQTDIEKHNAQYPEIKLKKLTTAHDRFFIIDRKTVY
ncbi:MAG: DNA-binding protein, partial [Bacteroidetes bacterium]